LKIVVFLTALSLLYSLQADKLSETFSKARVDGETRVVHYSRSANNSNTNVRFYTANPINADGAKDYSTVGEPVLIPTVNKTSKKITPLQSKKISFIGLMSLRELLTISLLFLIFTYVVYKVYRKSNILNIRLKTFTKVIIALELGVILFLIYEIIVLDRTENALFQATDEKLQMIQVADKLRQSSDDLTHFARTYAVTQDKVYESQYLSTLEIRHGKKARPIEYRSIYWDLDKKTREARHPDGEKVSLKELINKLPFSKFEIAKMKEAEDNSDDLVNLEVEAFSAVKSDNAPYAIELLHSRAYYEAKHKIMLPIDEMMSALYERTDAESIALEEKIQTQFRYILIIGLLFVLGNTFLYIILKKKIILPIEYLTGVIKRFKKGEYSIEEKSFYNDEIGEMNTEFFSMQNELQIRAHELEGERSFISSIISTSQVALVVINKHSEVTVWNQSATKIFGYTENEIVGKSVEVIIPEQFKALHYTGVDRVSTGGENKLVAKGSIEIQGVHKNGEVIEIELTLNKFMIDDEMFFSANIQDIGERIKLTKQVEKQTKDLKRQLKVVQMAERKQELLIKEIDEQKQFVQTLLDSQEQLIITTDGKTLVSVNKTFLDFYAVDSVNTFMDKYDAKCICDTFNTEAPKGYLQIQMGRETWIDYVISRSFDNNHKVMITRGNTDFIFSVSAAKLPGNNGVKSAVFTNITEMENAKVEIEAINKHTRESIEYASLIQNAFLPLENVMKPFFKDHAATWIPKDTVGGDIWLFNELRHEDECLLFFIDCTGHGVPGAFVTMIVKSIEREIVSKILKHPEFDISPAIIMAYFNKTMKTLLRQETKDSLSNAGWDGGIIYYNKRTQILKFAGAETPLFYIDENQEFKTIKGNRYSVGYKKCDANYEYKETIIEVKEGMKFYCTTDGYLDQNGGKKGFPFGKKKFSNIIKENHTKPMNALHKVLMNQLTEYQDIAPHNERNDDITIVTFEIDKV